MRRRLVPIVFGLLFWAAVPAAAQAASLGIDVLSNRADLISAGDALVEVKIPAGVSASKVRVYDDAREVTSSFALRSERALRGRRRRPRARRQRADARPRPVPRPRASRSSNHPNGGPVFSGPQVQPWACQASAADAQCNQPATYTYQYKSSLTGQFAAYDPAEPAVRRRRRRRPTRARRCRTSSASRPATRTATSTAIAVALRPEQAMDAVGAAGAAGTTSCVITHGASCGQSTRTTSGRHGARTSMNDDGALGAASR